MIKTAADLLKKFVDQERRVLDDYELVHGPTIGTMYEGLTQEVLQRSIPSQLGLQVVSGFAFHDNQLSGEIDCMVVRGNGEKVPYTNKYKWHISNVIAVFEVKKTLTAEEISDSYDHLRAISKIYANYVDSSDSKELKIDLSWPRRTFAQMTGQIPPPHKNTGSLPFDLEMLYHTIVSEYLNPARIVVGHHGWKKEKTLRDHIAKLLEDRLSAPKGMGAGSFPQLIIGGDFSLIKANGLPYVGPMIDETWGFVLSTSHNPMRILLEILFTKIDRICSTSLASDESNELEAMTLCLRTRAVKKGEIQGWEYLYDDYSSRDLKKRGDSYQWQPCELTNSEFVVVDMLCRGKNVRVDDPQFIAFANSQPGGVSSFINSLVATRLIAKSGVNLELTTINCVALATPDGKLVAGENNAGQMDNWLEYKLGTPKNEWKLLAFVPSSE
ncbi:DUF6602 domain-containing protein [Variovorax atrisoli]|uniref:DUF6602 domain-containing protein n=1 Tax=Variovorax atrisoli TaxID=3394203 RepID=UPI003396E0EE